MNVVVNNVESLRGMVNRLSDSVLMLLVILNHIVCSQAIIQAPISNGSRQGLEMANKDQLSDGIFKCLFPS
jgi:hypothetical protein